MNVIADIISYVVDTLASLYGAIVLLRFIFQLVKADFYNPVSQGIVKITSPILIPLRKVIPGLFGLDLAAVVLFAIIHLFNISLSAMLRGFNPFEIPGFISGYVLLKFLSNFMNVFTLALLVVIVMSFVAPMSRHPMAILAHQLAEPMMAPFRKILPPFGGIDISPIFIFMTLSVITRLLFELGSAFGVPVHNMWLFVLVDII